MWLLTLKMEGSLQAKEIGKLLELEKDTDSSLGLPEKNAAHQTTLA